MTPPDARIGAIRDWMTQALAWPAGFRLEIASADASFRRYFRAWDARGATRIVMDAPPPHEDVGPYLRATRLLAGCGVHVPEVLAEDRAAGLLLLEDLGSTHMLAALQAGGDADALYGAALDALALVQLRGAAAARELPRYDEALLRREMQLLPDWFCARHLRITLSAAEQALLEESFAFLVRESLAQPLVLVHRDYHSRNLMVTRERSPGVIDFQDAVAGPVGYDPVSLLRDCYVRWPAARVEAWLGTYRDRLLAGGADALAGADGAQFRRWFTVAGLQRHLKVLGIFARLWYRDGKRGYLADLPLTLDYVREAARGMRELASFHDWVEARLAPLLAEANQRVDAAEAR